MDVDNHPQEASEELEEPMQDDNDRLILCQPNHSITIATFNNPEMLSKEQCQGQEKNLS